MVFRPIADKTRWEGLVVCTWLVLLDGLMLVWAILYGFLMFGDVPRLETLAGAAIVVAAGLYIFHREARHGPYSGPIFVRHERLG